MSKSPLRLLAYLLLASTVSLFACGEDDEPLDNDTDVHLEEIAEVEVWDRVSGDRLAYVHGDHWDGGPIVLDEHMDQEDALDLEFKFLDEDEEELEVPLGDDGYEFEIHFANNDDNIEYEKHSSHVYIWGHEQGDATVWFDFLQNGESFYDTNFSSNLTILVREEDDHGHDDELEVSSFSILDRAHDPHQELAHLDGDQWHGAFEDGIDLMITDDTADYETAAAGEGHAISIGAIVEEMHDDHADEVHLNGAPYELEAVYAHSEDSDVVWISDSHGDHIHVVGIGEGHAHVIFQIVDRDHNDEVVFETPEFEFDVGHDH